MRSSLDSQQHTCEAQQLNARPIFSCTLKYWAEASALRRDSGQDGRDEVEREALRNGLHPYESDSIQTFSYQANITYGTGDWNIFHPFYSHILRLITHHCFQVVHTRKVSQSSWVRAGMNIGKREIIDGGYSQAHSSIHTSAQVLTTT